MLVCVSVCTCALPGIRTFLNALCTKPPSDLIYTHYMEAYPGSITLLDQNAMKP